MKKKDFIREILLILGVCRSKGFEFFFNKLYNHLILKWFNYLRPIG